MDFSAQEVTSRLEGHQRNLSRNSRIANTSADMVAAGADHHPQAQHAATNHPQIHGSQVPFRSNLQQRTQIGQTVLSCEPIGTEMATMSRNLRRQDTQSELTLAASKIAKISKALELPPATQASKNTAVLLRNVANANNGISSGNQKYSTTSSKSAAANTNNIGSNRSQQQPRSSQNNTNSSQQSRQGGADLTGSGSGSNGPTVHVVGAIIHSKHEIAASSQQTQPQTQSQQHYNNNYVIEANTASNQNGLPVPIKATSSIVPGRPSLAASSATTMLDEPYGAASTSNPVQAALAASEYENSANSSYQPQFSHHHQHNQYQNHQNSRSSGQHHRQIAPQQIQIQAAGSQTSAAQPPIHFHFNLTHSSGGVETMHQFQQSMNEGPPMVPNQSHAELFETHNSHQRSSATNINVVNGSNHHHQGSQQLETTPQQVIVSFPQAFFTRSSNQNNNNGLNGGTGPSGDAVNINKALLGGSGSGSMHEDIEQNINILPPMQSTASLVGVQQPQTQQTTNQKQNETTSIVVGSPSAGQNHDEGLQLGITTHRMTSVTAPQGQSIELNQFAFEALRQALETSTSVAAANSSTNNANQHQATYNQATAVAIQALSPQQTAAEAQHVANHHQYQQRTRLTAWNMINSRNGNSIYIRPNTPIRNTMEQHQYAGGTNSQIGDNGSTFGRHDAGLVNLSKTDPPPSAMRNFAHEFQSSLHQNHQIAMQQQQQAYSHLEQESHGFQSRNVTQSQVVNRQSTSNRGQNTLQGQEDASEGGLHQVNSVTGIGMAVNTAAIPPTCTPNTGAYSQVNTNAMITNTPAQSTSETTNLRRNIGNVAQTLLNANAIMTFNTSNNGLILGNGTDSIDGRCHQIILNDGQQLQQRQEKIHQHFLNQQTMNELASRTHQRNMRAYLPPLPTTQQMSVSNTNSQLREPQQDSQINEICIRNYEDDILNDNNQDSGSAAQNRKSDGSLLTQNMSQCASGILQQPNSSQPSTFLAQNIRHNQLSTSIIIDQTNSTVNEDDGGLLNPGQTQTSWGADHENGNRYQNTNQRKINQNVFVPPPTNTDNQSPPTSSCGALQTPFSLPPASVRRIYQPVHHMSTRISSGGHQQQMVQYQQTSPPQPPQTRQEDDCASLFSRRGGQNYHRQHQQQMILPSLTEETGDRDAINTTLDDDNSRGAGANCPNTNQSSRNSIIEPPPASYASKSGFIAIQANNSSSCNDNDTDSAGCVEHHQLQLIADGNSEENAVQIHQTDAQPSPDNLFFRQEQAETDGSRHQQSTILLPQIRNNSLQLTQIMASENPGNNSGAAPGNNSQNQSSQHNHHNHPRQLQLINQNSSSVGDASSSILATPMTSNVITSSTFNSIQNNPTANTSVINHRISESDVRSHQILHRAEQQLIYLQRPPPPSPLKNGETSNNSMVFVERNRQHQPAAQHQQNHQTMQNQQRGIIMHRQPNSEAQMTVLNHQLRGSCSDKSSTSRGNSGVRPHRFYHHLTNGLCSSANIGQITPSDADKSCGDSPRMRQQRLMTNLNPQQCMGMVYHPQTMVQPSLDGGIPTPVLVHHELKIQESQLEYATDLGEQDLAPSSHCCFATAQHNNELNAGAFKWTKVDQSKQKDEQIVALKREIVALSGQNAELIALLSRHAGECPGLQNSLNAYFNNQIATRAENHGDSTILSQTSHQQLQMQILGAGQHVQNHQSQQQELLVIQHEPSVRDEAEDKDIGGEDKANLVGDKENVVATGLQKPQSFTNHAQRPEEEEKKEVCSGGDDGSRNGAPASSRPSQILK